VKYAVLKCISVLVLVSQNNTPSYLIPVTVKFYLQ